MLRGAGRRPGPPPTRSGCILRRRQTRRFPFSAPAGRSRRWLGAVPAAGVWAARQSPPCVQIVPPRGRDAAMGNGPEGRCASQPPSGCPVRSRGPWRRLRRVTAPGKAHAATLATTGSCALHAPSSSTRPEGQQQGMPEVAAGDRSDEADQGERHERVAVPSYEHRCAHGAPDHPPHDQHGVD